MKIMINGNGHDKPYEVKPMPASIVKAMLAVQKQVTKLAKEGQNDFGGFSFTSVDQIYELLGTKLADAGLIIMPVEVEPTRVEVHQTPKGEAKYGWFQIGFIYATETDTWSDPMAVERLLVKLEGSTTFHGAKSLAQKTHLRSTFKVPTGEADLDLGEGKDEVRPQPVAKKGKKLTSEQSWDAREGMLKAIKEKRGRWTPDELQSFADNNGSILDVMVPAHKAEVERVFAESTKKATAQ